MDETNNNSHKIILWKMIKSKYILKQITDNLQQNKLLEIIRYNHNFQKIINININDYKKEYFKIEIEIIPSDNTYGKFISISKNNEAHYHIYFNNNKKETKVKKITKPDNVKKIKIIIDNKMKSLIGLFKKCTCIKSINFIKFNRRDIKNMSEMFYGCYSLEELNLLRLKTDNVEDMSYMFYECSILKELNLSNFNTNNVTNMSHMFYNCSSLKKLNFSNFNTNKVTNMLFMFFGCSSLFL